MDLHIKIPYHLGNHKAHFKAGKTAFSRNQQKSTIANGNLPKKRDLLLSNTVPRSKRELVDDSKIVLYILFITEPSLWHKGVGIGEVARGAVCWKLRHID